MTTPVTIPEMIAEAYDNAKAHGWWPDGEKPNFGEKIALMHTELSEAFEEWRNGVPLDEVYATIKDGTTGQMYRSTDPVFMQGEKPEGVPIELADVIIRIFDLCGHFKIDLEKAITMKLEYNRSRPYRHGGKKA